MALVEVAQFDNVLTAEMARGMLIAAGIEAQLFDTGLASVLGGMLGPARLLVGEQDEARALRLLAETA